MLARWDHGTCSQPKYSAEVGMSDTQSDHVESIVGPGDSATEVGSLAVARLVGALFIAATAATMISQIMMEPLTAETILASELERHRQTIAFATVFEIINAPGERRHCNRALSIAPTVRRGAGNRLSRDPFDRRGRWSLRRYWIDHAVARRSVACASFFVDARLVVFVRAHRV